MVENKMGTMEIKKLILSMSIPIMISMLIQALYNIVDSMFVARVSDEALTAVSLCYPVQMIIVAVACGTAVGMNTLLSRYLGEKRSEEANQTALHGIFLAICNGIIFAVIGGFFSEAFLGFFSSDNQTIEMGVSYLRICTIFSVSIFVQITYERIMQSTGNTIYNMIIQGIGALTNIVLDPIFIFGYFGIPAMGVTGAAIATVTGQIFAMLLGIIVTQKKITAVQIHLKQWKFDKSMISQIYRVGFPAILMQSIMSFMTVFMNMILMPFSALAVSVFSIYYKLQQFVFMAITGMTCALIPIVSYNYGARKKTRILEAIRFSLVISTCIMLVGTIIFQLIPKQLLYLFDAKENMLEIGIPALRLISTSFVFAGVSIVLCSVFQALGHERKSLVITLLRQLLLLIPLTWIFAHIFGLNNCWWAFLITEVVCAVISLKALSAVKKNSISKI